MVNWKRWLTQPKLELWQACALLQEVDPDTLRRQDRAGSKGGPTFINAPQAFGSAATYEAFTQALEAAAAAAAYDGPIMLRDRLSRGMNPKTALVDLRDVVTYFRSMGTPIPERLRELPQPPIDTEAEREFESAFRGTQLNGAPVDWGYWMQMRSLTIQQAAMLMQGFDPDKVSSLEDGPHTEPHRSARERARKIERLATVNREPERSPGQWLEWAIQNSLPVCKDFSAEVDRNPAPAPVPTGNESGGGGATKPIQRTAAQDTAILDYIKVAGFDPKALPKRVPGKPWVKTRVKERVTKSQPGLFIGSTVFDKAWERLRAAGEISEAK